MKFKNDLKLLYAENNISNGITIPTSRDVYFCAKQKELISQYSQARFFLSKTDKQEIKKYVEPGEDELLYRSCFYETALLYYNIVVDLSWALCYTSLEYYVNNSGQANKYGGLSSLEESFNNLRIAEKNSLSPTDPASPFIYFNKISPAYSNVINHITSFWKNYSNSDIRNDYNYIKHKGKPYYIEQEQTSDCKLISVTLSGGSLATDSRDVMKKIKLVQAITKLQQFDENELFPYIKALIKELYTLVNPSALVQ